MMAAAVKTCQIKLNRIARNVIIWFIRQPLQKLPMQISLQRLTWHVLTASFLIKEVPTASVHWFYMQTIAQYAADSR